MQKGINAYYDRGFRIQETEFLYPKRSAQLCAIMAKDKEREIAFTMFTEQCRTRKEIAEFLRVNPKTVGSWADEGEWEDIKKAKQTTTDTLLQKYHKLLAALLDKCLEYEKRELDDGDRRDYNGIIDEMSKVSAMIDKIQKDGRPSLRIHIMCIEKFMGALNTKDAKLYRLLVDFQIEYLQLLAEELK